MESRNAFLRRGRHQTGSLVGRPRAGSECDIKDLDKEIREARKVPAPPASLNKTLEAQKEMKALQPTCNKKRRELFDAQGSIDEQRDGLIGKIEKQLKQRHSVQPLFRFRWSAV